MTNWKKKHKLNKENVQNKEEVKENFWSNKTNWSFVSLDWKTHCEIKEEKKQTGKTWKGDFVSLYEENNNEKK